MTARDDYPHLAELVDDEFGVVSADAGSALDEIDRLRRERATLVSAWNQLSSEYRAFEAATRRTCEQRTTPARNTRWLRRGAAAQ